MNTRKRTFLTPLLCTTAIVAAGAAVEAYAQGSQTPMNALSVEPRVPRLAITPCVVELFRDIGTGYYAEPMFEPEFQYTPPANCPGPWAKVIFSVDVKGPGTTRIANTTFGLGDATGSQWRSIELMVIGAQFNSRQPSWRIERDVTEYQALLRDPRPGFARDTDIYYRDPNDENGAVATGRLIFYPANAAQPAPEVPDLVINATSGTIGPLPRNIERVYMDVYAFEPRFWFTCVPFQAANDWPLLTATPMAIGDITITYEPDAQGCAGTGYRDLVVTIDGQAAGTAPIYPWLNSDLNERFNRSVDVPVPTPQSINLMPYRIDLTPFAAVLNDGLPHQIRVEHSNGGLPFQASFDSAQLLLYLDRASTQVSGGLTLNTLAIAPVETTIVRDNWVAGTDGVLRGDVERRYRRNYRIEGYVNTSRGRVDTTVTQEQVLTNVQQVSLARFENYEDHDYAQNLDLTSVTERTSLRQRGTTVLALDRVRHHFPLSIDYAATGGYADGPYSQAHLDRASAYVVQGHHQQRSHYRPAGSYADRVYANFAGGRAFDASTNSSTEWNGARSHYFTDNLGSCSRERITWQAGEPTSHTLGIGCPDGVNRVRGFAHPDGSPDNLGWLR